MILNGVNDETRIKVGGRQRDWCFRNCTHTYRNISRTLVRSVYFRTETRSTPQNGMAISGRIVSISRPHPRAILGDMIGAPYEFDQSPKTKTFPLFGRDSVFTDDSVMTIAVAQALLEVRPGEPREETKKRVAASMQTWGRRYPNAGYGGRFRQWLRAENPAPYGSYGNGSAMRVSSAGWLFGTLEETKDMAQRTAEVTHNHPEGIRGAVVTARCIYLARTGALKEQIRAFVREQGYDLTRTCDEIRPTYRHVESCQGTVPEAVTAFLEGTDFEDVIRTAVSLDGNCDTLTCIAGSIAEAFYGVPSALKRACEERLPEDMREVLHRFNARRTQIAVRDDWKTLPMPEEHETFVLHRGSQRQNFGAFGWAISRRRWRTSGSGTWRETACICTAAGRDTASSSGRSMSERKNRRSLQTGIRTRSGTPPCRRIPQC